jgi:hypothetical protein
MQLQQAKFQLTRGALNASDVGFCCIRLFMHKNLASVQHLVKLKLNC